MCQIRIQPIWGKLPPAKIIGPSFRNESMHSYQTELQARRKNYCSETDRCKRFIKRGKIAIGFGIISFLSPILGKVQLRTCSHMRR
jgi:hypothetical protein